MEITNYIHEDTWQEIKDMAISTVGKTHGTYPTSQWKKKILMAEHSPIRLLTFSWTWRDLPYWVSNHFVRHKYGIEHFVKSQRTDRTGEDRDTLPQDTPINHSVHANAQALINISRKRLCNKAAQKTREAWKLVKDQVSSTEPELASCMVRECVYRNGLCPEMYSCGYNKTENFYKELEEYQMEKEE